MIECILVSKDQSSKWRNEDGERGEAKKGVSGLPFLQQKERKTKRMGVSSQNTNIRAYQSV